MSGAPTVFLLDDDSAGLKAISRLLRAEGFSVRTFNSPQAFLEQHDVNVPGCLVLDVAMPTLNGLELQQALKASGAERYIVFITGHGDIPASVRAMKAGAVNFLAKPVDESHLRGRSRRSPQQGSTGSPIARRAPIVKRETGLPHAT